MLSSKFLIVHATDIHYSSYQSSHCEEVVTALNYDIKKQIRGQKKVPFIVSGDIAQSGQSSAQYEGLATLLLDVVTDNDLKICITPGNHDVSRSFIQQNFATILGTSSSHPDWKSLSSYLTGQEDFYRKAMEEYIKFESYFDGLGCCSKSVFGSGYTLPNATGMFLLNSGFSSFGGLKLGGRETDYGHLLLNLEPLSAWIKDTPNIEQRILSMHHPLSWYREDVRAELKRIIDLHFGAVLLGHEHSPSVNSTTGFLGTSTVMLQGGALASHEHTQQFYQVVESDFIRNTLSTSIRHFSKTLVSFNEGTTITGTPSGITKYESVWTNLNNRKFQRAIKRYQNLLERTLNSSAIGETVIHVEPSLTRKPIQQYEKKRDAPRHTLEDICALDGNILINTPSQYGGSVLAYSIALTQLRSGSKSIILSADELPKYRGAIGKYLSNASQDIGLECNDEICVFIIDDFNAGNSTHVKSSTLLRKMHPEAQVIFLNKEMQVLTSSTIFDSVVSNNIYYLNALSKGNVRQLIAKHPAKSAFSCLDDITEKVVMEVERLNLHRNAFTVLMLTDIFAKDGVYNPLNRAKLVKRYFEEVFNKDHDSLGYTEELDFEDNMHLLTEFTGSLFGQDEFTFTEEQWEVFCLKFKGLYGGNWLATNALQFYINKRIFKHGVDKYHFNQSMWTWYFLALKVNKDTEFKAAILKNGRYSAFPQVMEFASGLSRNDAELLHVLAQDLKGTISYYREESKLSQKFQPYNDFTLSVKEESLDEFNKALAMQVFDNVPNLIELDEEADENYDFGTPFEQIVKTSIYTERLILLFKTLETTALCVRNLDQDLLDTRLEVCEIYLEGLELFSQALFLSIPKLLKEGTAHVSGIVFKLYYPVNPKFMMETPEQKFKRRHFNLIIDMPRRISEILLESLGSARLWADLPGPENPNTTNFSKLLLCIAHIQLRNQDWFNDVLKYINYFDTDSVFLETLKLNLANCIKENSLDDIAKDQLSHAMAATMLRQKGVQRVTEQACKAKWSSMITRKVTGELLSSKLALPKPASPLD